MSTPSRNVRLHGTEQPAAEPRVLRAGALSAELDAGNLRHVRVGGVEIIRAVSFIVRDRDWGTYEPDIADLQVEESDERFSVGYTAVAREGERSFEYRARIVGTPDELVFEASGASPGGFTTNRTGFVVLHPVDGVAGRPVRIEHVDGSTVDGRFPEAIDPVQPMMELRALRHEPVAGLAVECRMEGDTFEMEDQRNWTDASYKTYVRPLARPWPYELEPGVALQQRVVVGVRGEAPATAEDGAGVTLSFGDALTPLPAVGVALDAPTHASGGGRPTDERPDETTVGHLAALGIAHALCHHDPRRGDDATSLARAVELARVLGATPRLEAVVVEVDDFARELEALGEAVAALDAPFETVFVSPAADMKGTLPGSEWPPAPPLDVLYAKAREVFPGARIGGGTFAFFTELNRKRPPPDALDTVCFTTSALVHAGDDATAMENLEALPFVVSTARDIAGDKPLSIGPSALGMRLNPYGDAPMENPGNVRQAMNRRDPRQRGLFGAAWLLGYAAGALVDGVESLIAGSALGEHGVVHVPGADPAPWYDEHGGVYPLYHVLRTLARWRDRPRRALHSSLPARVRGIACDVDGAIEALVANLSAERVTLALPSAPASRRVLDADAFVAAAADPAWLDANDTDGGAEESGAAGARTDGRRLELDAYAVVRLRWDRA